MTDEPLQDTLPSSTDDATDRFEAAPDPDGTLIPIPKEAPIGRPIRDKAEVTVSPRQATGYYVTIYNGEVGADVFGFSAKLLTSLSRLEDMFTLSADSVLRFSSLLVGGFISLSPTSPVIDEDFVQGTRSVKERYIRTKLNDGIPVTYAILSPKH